MAADIALSGREWKDQRPFHVVPDQNPYVVFCCSFCSYLSHFRCCVTQISSELGPQAALVDSTARKTAAFAFGAVQFGLLSDDPTGRTHFY